MAKRISARAITWKDQDSWSHHLFRSAKGTSWSLCKLITRQRYCKWVPQFFFFFFANQKDSLAVSHFVDRTGFRRKEAGGLILLAKITCSTFSSQRSMVSWQNSSILYAMAQIIMTTYSFYVSTPLDIEISNERLWNKLQYELVQWLVKHIMQN